MGEGVAEKKKSADGTINGIAIGLTTVVSLVLASACSGPCPRS
jgi:hypothetical protein